MKKISEKDYDRFILVDLENSRLKHENLFLYQKIKEFRIKMDYEETTLKDKWQSKLWSECCISIRLMNVFEHVQMKTVSDTLIKINRDGIMSFKSFMGKKSFEELLAFFEENNILI